MNLPLGTLIEGRCGRFIVVGPPEVSDVDFLGRPVEFRAQRIESVSKRNAWQRRYKYLALIEGEEYSVVGRLPPNKCKVCRYRARDGFTLCPDHLALLFMVA